MKESSVLCAKPSNSEPNLKTVLVFKTSVVYKYQVKGLAKLLDRFGKWNFDLEDCDNILRIEANTSVAKSIVDFMNDQGYYCTELA